MVKGVTDSYESLVNLLESFESFLARLDIYTKINPTIGMTEMVVKILVEFLSTLALVTKQIKQGKSSESVIREILRCVTQHNVEKIAKKLFGGDTDIEAVLTKLDRLTQEEARITAAQTLEVVYGNIQNMREEIMHQLASDQNKSKRELSFNVAILSDSYDRDPLAGDKLQQDIFRWLSPPDPWKNHNIACKSRHPGSAAWFIHGDTFSEWKVSDAPSSSLWIHGKRALMPSCYDFIETEFGFPSL